MENWWICFGISLIIPAVLALAGLLSWKHCPKKINSLVGYRTARSMKNEETWRYANETCGKFFFRTGLGMALLSAALLLALLRASREAIGGVTAGRCLINLIPIFVCIAKTESALKKRFPD